MDAAKKLKSRDYPAISLKRAIEFARRIYEKDRFQEAPALTAVRHMGYSGLNGGSRPVLSALRKYGLVEYLGSGDNLRVKLTELAKNIFLPRSDAEKADAIWEAMNSPQVHAELLASFPHWDLPSDETLAVRLEREFRLQPAAISPFIHDLREGLEYARQFGPMNPNVVETESGSAGSTSESPGHAPSDRRGPSGDSGPTVPSADGVGSDSRSTGARGLMKIPMPGSAAYIMLPEETTPVEAKRVLLWLKLVVTPAVEFASRTEVDVEEK